jgi:hypothetical protein
MWMPKEQVGPTVKRFLYPWAISLGLCSLSKTGHSERIIHILKDQFQTSTKIIQNELQENVRVSATTHAKLEDLSSIQSKNTDVVLRTGRATLQAVEKCNSDSHVQHMKVQQTVNQLSSAIGSMKDLMGELSHAQRDANATVSDTDIGKAMENILRAMVLLVSGLQVIFRGLM